MSIKPTEPTPEEQAEYPLDPDAEEIEWNFKGRIGGGPQVTFTPEQLDDLFAACELANEDSVSFVKQAALERIADVLGRQHSESPAAGGS